MQKYNTLGKSVHYSFAKLCHDSHSKKSKSDFFQGNFNYIERKLSLIVFGYKIDTFNISWFIALFSLIV